MEMKGTTWLVVRESITNLAVSNIDINNTWEAKK